MTTEINKAIKEAIGAIVIDDIERSIAQINAIKSIDAVKGGCEITLAFNYAQASSQQSIVNQIFLALDNEQVKPHLLAANIKKVNVEFENNIQTHEVHNTKATIPGVKNIIAVGSGKGGVGKSTVSANLAVALSEEGANVAILDADIYGPSQPRMMGVKGKPVSEDGKTMQPLIADLPNGKQIAVNSIGFLIEEDTPMIWRGPMVTQALLQLALETHWNHHLAGKDIDYLIIDLPPGTGDIQLTLSQKIPVTAAVIVTTPQDIALLDAKKAFKMFNKVKIPVIGVVENMSYFECPNCQTKTAIFGEHGGQEMVDLYESRLIAQIPLDIEIRKNADGGLPSVLANPELHSSKIYTQAAKRISASMSLMKKSFKDIFPGIQMGSSPKSAKGSAGIAVTKVDKA